MHIPKITGPKTRVGILATAGMVLLATAPNIAKAQKSDTFERTTNLEQVDSLAFPSAKGSDSAKFLANAPSPKLTVIGENKLATFIVDLAKNILYHYNDEGKAIFAYRIASGKVGCDTETGLRVVSHVESYPYNTAPKTTKRRRTPWSYGPKIICLEKLDPSTGEKSLTGEFIHGNNDPSSIGKYASQGCMRMDNEVIVKLSKLVKRGNLVLIKR